MFRSILFKRFLLVLLILSEMSRCIKRKFRENCLARSDKILVSLETLNHILKLQIEDTRLFVMRRLIVTSEFEDLDILKTIRRELKRAELTGVLDLEVHIQSEYVFNCLKKWSPGWTRRSGPSGLWRNSKGRV